MDAVVSPIHPINIFHFKKNTLKTIKKPYSEPYPPSNISNRKKTPITIPGILKNLAIQKHCGFNIF